MIPPFSLLDRRPTRRPLALARAAGLASALLTGAASAGGAGPDPTLEAVRQALADGGARLVEADPVDGQGPRELGPEPLLDRLGTDLPCGSPLAALVRRTLPELSESRRVEVLALLAPPRLSMPSGLAQPALGLQLEADLSAGSRHAVGRRDADFDGVPDALAALAADARAAVAAVEQALGWRPDQRGTPIRVLLAEIAHEEGVADGDLVVLPRGVDGPARVAALAHQLAHLALEDQEPDLPPGFSETLAARVGRDARLAAGLAEPAPRGAESARALFSPGLLGAADEAAFLGHAARAGGMSPGWTAELVASTSRRLDTERARSEAVPTLAARRAVAEALDEILARGGSSLADAVSSWHVARAEADLARDGAAVAVDVVLPPTADVAVAGTELPPFARLRFGLEIPERGGLEIDFDADDRAEAAVVALLDDGSVRSWPLAPDAAGDRGLALPAAHVVAALVVVQAPAIPEDLGAFEPDAVGPVAGDFALAVTHDPRLPVAFEALSARVAPGQVTVEWITSSEDGLVGWLVERASRPAGPWRQLSPIPLPAFSQPGEPGSYAFVDPTAEPDRVLHYRLRAITVAGLSELSPVLAVRTLPRGPQAVATERRALR